jgi:GNAT superfamily N-acetyltransferase
MISYQEERFQDVIDEAMPLLKKHWEEIALNKDSVPLDPDIEMYNGMSDQGMLHITTARDDGVLIGYAAYFIMPNLHYRSLKVGESDIFWLEPAYRKGMIGTKMLVTAEMQMEAKGVNFIVNKVKLHYDIGAVFERLGYKPFERLYSKKLGV